MRPLVQQLASHHACALDKPHVRILDFANHAAQIRRSFATFWNETRAPSDASAVDVDAELADAVTSHTILCDYFPALYDASAPQIRDARAFVQAHVLPLERDAFQQVLDALRLSCTSLSRLADCDGDDDLSTRFAFEYVERTQERVAAGPNALALTVQLRHGRAAQESS